MTELEILETGDGIKTANEFKSIVNDIEIV